MMTFLQVENYRGFEHFAFPELSRVNLLVGKNNCGKTSLLEAVQILTSGGDPWILADIASRRGEVILRSQERKGYRSGREYLPDISHFFHGHEVTPDATFILSADDGIGDIAASIATISDLPKQRGLFEEELAAVSPFVIRFEGAAARHTYPIPISQDGAIALEHAIRFRRVPKPDLDDSISSQFVAPDSLEPQSMSEMWDKVVLEGREEDVIDAMRILEPTLTNIFFLSGERHYRYGRRGGILLGFEGAKRRIPLGSHGEGMWRLLAISLSVIRAGGGVLLIDEVDTGLHWSIMGDMWLLLVKAAQESGVQVFATTHSLDCVRGLAWLCENYPNLENEVSLQKIDRSLEQAVRLDGKDIAVAVEHGIEVR